MDLTFPISPTMAAYLGVRAEFNPEAPADPIEHQAEPSEAAGGIREAIQKARADLAAGKSLFGGGEEKGEEAKAEDDAGAAAEGEEKETGETEDLEEDTDDAGEGEDADEGGDEGEEGEEAAGEEDDDQEEGEAAPYVLKLPGRRPGDPDVEVQLDGLSGEEREALNRQRNGYLRRQKYDQLRGELEQDRAEVDQVLTGLQLDPVGFISSQVDKKLQAKLVKHLLTDDAVYAEVVEEISEWDGDEREKRARVAELKEERRQEEQQARDRAAALTEARRNVQEITSTLEGMVPSSMDPDQAQQFMGYALRDLQEYATKNRTNRLTPDQVVQVLKSTGTLRLFGVKPKPPAARRRAAARSAASSDTSLPTARPKGATEEGIRRRQAQKTGEKFRKASATRRAAAATAPAGAGAAPASLKPPKGQGIKERVAWFRQQRGK